MSKKKSKNKKNEDENSIEINDFNEEYESDIDLEEDENFMNSFEESDNCAVSSMVEEDDDFFENDNDYNFDVYKENIIVNPEDRISKNRLTIYELVRVLGERQKQLTLGAKPLVKNYGDLSYEEISILELKNGMLPFKIRRKINNNYEIWDITELKFDHLLSRLD
jgi:DNA-directed RNA polymerase subunit K/omega